MVVCTLFQVYSCVHKQKYHINVSCPEKLETLKTVIGHLLEVSNANVKKVRIDSLCNLCA